MLMICNYRALLLAGAFSLPAMADEAVIWEFAGTTYTVQGHSSNYTVDAVRTSKLSTNQIKSLCRKGLGLPLRAEYEDELIVKGVINERFSSWPLTNLKYELADIRYSDVSRTSATCSATLTDSGKATNLKTTALSYAVAYYTTKQYDALKQMLPYVMKQPAIAMDGAGLVTLLLSQQDIKKAQAYYEHYVDVAAVKNDSIKLWLAQWQQDIDLSQSISIAKQCQSSACQQLLIQLEDMIAEQEQDSAGDLSSYF